MWALLIAGTVSASSADLSPKAQALVTAIAASIEQVRSHQAALPPAKDDAERILRLGERDQAPRRVIVAWDFSTIPEAERATALERAAALIDAVDREDQAALLKLIPPEGWFFSRKYGRRAVWAAFDIIQHADLDLQERFSPSSDGWFQAARFPARASP